MKNYQKELQKFLNNFLNLLLIQYQLLIQGLNTMSQTGGQGGLLGN